MPEKTAKPKKTLRPEKTWQVTQWPTSRFPAVALVTAHTKGEARARLRALNQMASLPPGVEMEAVR